MPEKVTAINTHEGLYVSARSGDKVLLCVLLPDNCVIEITLSLDAALKLCRSIGNLKLYDFASKGEV